MENPSLFPQQEVCPYYIQVIRGYENIHVDLSHNTFATTRISTINEYQYAYLHKQ